MQTVQVFGGKVAGEGGPRDCPWCRRAVALLNKRGIPHVYRDVGEALVRTDLDARLPGSTSIPQIFVGEKHVGGFTDLAAIERSGALQQMIAGA